MTSAGTLESILELGYAFRGASMGHSTPDVENRSLRAMAYRSRRAAPLPRTPLASR
jgi:hypothetical protein